MILGNNDYCKLIKDGKSAKHKKAEERILAGQDLTILSETVFLDLLHDSQVSQDIESIKFREIKPPTKTEQETAKEKKTDLSFGINLGSANITLDDIQNYSTIRCSVCDTANAISFRSDHWDTDKLICNKCWDKKYAGHIKAENEYRNAYALEKTDLQKAIDIYRMLTVNKDFKNLWAHDRLIVLYKKSKHYDEAIKICQLAVDKQEEYIQLKSLKTVWPLFNHYKLELAKLKYKIDPSNENLNELNYQKEKEAQYITKKNTVADEMRNR